MSLDTSLTKISGKTIAMMGVLLFVAFFLLGNLPDELFFEMGVSPTAGVNLQ